MSNYKYQDNYPRERWGSYSEYQDMVNLNIYKQHHEEEKHTKSCELYIPVAFVKICRFTGEVVKTKLEQFNSQ